MKFQLIYLTFIIAFVSSSPTREFSTYNPFRLLEQSRIVGGEQTTIEKYPHIGSLQFSGRHRCGANILNENFLLTAAHCTIGLTASLLSVRLGSSFHATDGVLHRVSRTIEHSMYDARTIDYDYSILEVAEKIVFNERIQPIRIPRQDEQFLEGIAFTLGWGSTLNVNESSDQLRIVFVPIMDRDLCQRLYGVRGMEITLRMICAGYIEGGKDACQGDSGGPLSVPIPIFGRLLDDDKKPLLIGLVSWGIGCAQPNFSGVYSYIPAVSNWVRDNAKLDYLY